MVTGNWLVDIGLGLFVLGLGLIVLSVGVMLLRAAWEMWSSF